MGSTSIFNDLERCDEQVLCEVERHIDQACDSLLEYAKKEHIPTWQIEYIAFTALRERFLSEQIKLRFLAAARKAGEHEKS